MRAIILNQFGGPEVLNISEIEKPIPSEEQLLVEIKATALNRADLLQRRGKYPPPEGESNIPGIEIAGIVVKIGTKVTDFKVGDRIFGLVGSGGYAEYCLIDQKVALPVPDQLNFIEAAAIPEAFLTAMESLFTLGDLQQNETILIHAGASGVGSAAIQLAKQLNAYVYTTIGAYEKIAKVKALGADQVIQYKNEDFANIIKKPVDIIIDFIGGNYLSRHLNILNIKGRLICVGLMGGTKAEIDLRLVQSKRLQIKGLIMRSRPLQEKREIAAHFKNLWLPLFKNQQLKPVVDSVFSFDQIKKAHNYMESNANVGKIVIEM